MSQTIGQLLQKERKQRGWTVADVAHDTHIHADTIRGLEADDYSVFSSTTYAKSFLQLYSRHLEVDANETLHDFDSVTENLNSGNFSYLKSVTSAIEPGETIQAHEDINHRAPYKDNNRQPFPLFLALVVFLLLLIIPVFYFVGKKADSFEEAGTIFKDAIYSKNESPASTTDQVQNSGSPSPTAPLIASGTPPSTQLPELESSKHRFPRPLPTEKNNSVALPDAALPLKAIPIIPKISHPGKSDTAQNRE